MHLNNYEHNYELDNFISHWEAVSIGRLSQVSQELRKGSLLEEINTCATSILIKTRNISKETHFWDQMDIYQLQAGKLERIYDKLLQIPDASLKLKVYDFLALSTLIKCSQAYLKLKKMKEGLIEGVDLMQVKSLFSEFNHAIYSMDNVNRNENSAVYPEIRELLREANVIPILDLIKGNSDLENAIVENYFILLELPEELRLHPAFHVRIFFRAIDELAKQMPIQEKSFSLDAFADELRKLLRHYSAQILSMKLIKNGSYILRKSSKPNLYSQENGRSELKYIPISVDVRVKSDDDDQIIAYLVYYDTKSKEWVRMIEGEESTEELDALTGDAREPNLEMLFKDTMIKFPIRDYGDNNSKELIICLGQAWSIKEFLKSTL